MTTYNTRNPVGSTDPRDLYDNAENMDLLSAGPEMEYPDRLGVPRKSWAGMEQDFDQAQSDRQASYEAWLAAAGFESTHLSYIDGQPLTVERPTQLIDYSGSVYRVKMPAGFPVSLSGVWADDALLLTDVGDQSLRNYLASTDGSDAVGHGTSTVGNALDALLANPSPLMAPFNAVGDGAADDTAAFSSLESVATGRTIDLAGRTYLVSAIPTRNTYTNGYFKVGSFTHVANEHFAPISVSPRFHSYGGQLRKLHEALTDPLTQYLGVVFIGDSITWGQTLPGNSTTEPRTGLLSDPRNNFGAPSYVNEFKRHIGRAYFDGVAPVLSNWATSPSGESTAEYTRDVYLYPGQAPFTTTATGASLSISEVDSPASPHGRQYRLVDANTADTSYYSVKFSFTGNKFTLVYAGVVGDAMEYQLYVDGVLQGSYKTDDGTTAAGKERTHTFTYVNNKVIEIRTNRVGASSAQSLRLEAIKIPKTVRITNQGINGSAFRAYINNNMSGNAAGDVRVQYYKFFFVQLGTNDRGSNVLPYGVLTLKKNASDMIDLITPVGDVIMMAANPAVLDSPPTYRFKMLDVRNTLSKLSKEKSVDFIDNFSIFEGANLNDVTADGLHPNALGHKMISRNIVGALESS